jgi:hypothetical protein
LSVFFDRVGDRTAEPRSYDAQQHLANGGRQLINSRVCHPACSIRKIARRRSGQPFVSGQQGDSTSERF